MQPWTGRTIFIDDNVHTGRWGTDHRRQRIEAANVKSEKVSENMFDLLDEGAHSIKSRWAELSMSDSHFEIEDEDCRKRPGAAVLQKSQGLRVPAALPLLWASMMPKWKRAEVGCNAVIGSRNPLCLVDVSLPDNKVQMSNGQRGPCIYLG